ncbi:ATP-binding protein [Actinoplanes sp. NBRC 103695]|uniref:sensor histidine kinase n=1 Tax=Actinoplanes sp. NBRC 103695 TaxID=3032202 RepID=UPI0024A42CB1|nr:ATP-binding protein [Actinoplanes sp. NBRC 103695]GLY97827.1 two-component sensor histidine kinase [Actinoplanes sp. NBRC 103695]
MSFRLRIFALVVLIALTAIGATAWLTLSLTSREIAQSEENEATHQTRILEEVRQYGLRHGRWPGISVVVGELARSTGLHIQVRTIDGAVLADSDTIEGRRSGPVRGAPLTVDPQPELAGVVRVGTPVSWPVDGLVKLPADLFGSTGADGGPAVLAVRQLAQYRAALIAVRCIADENPAEPALLLDRVPYLTPTQISGQPACVTAAANRVVTDTAWLKEVSQSFAPCVGPVDPDKVTSCLRLAFVRNVGDFSAVPLRLYLGFRSDRDIADLGSPALLGVAGLMVVALVGTALIARRVSRPVWLLTEASLRLADGKLDVRVPIKGRGELALLSASFNAMAEAVQSSEERQRRLIADIAHEMRTPLSNLRGYLEGLSDGVVEPSRELFVSLHEETLLQRRILDDLQELALAEAGDLTYTRTSFDLAELATNSATAHRAVAAEAGVELVVEAPGGTWVRADPERLRQVLGNLLTNAIRYTDRGGLVEIKARPEVFEAVLMVRDTGVGIAPEDVPRVFDRFWRADPARQRATGGSGLGLTIAHRIVTDHGGRISVTSTPGKGTTFVVRLPLDPWGGS